MYAIPILADAFHQLVAARFQDTAHLSRGPALGADAAARGHRSACDRPRRNRGCGGLYRRGRRFAFSAGARRRRSAPPSITLAAVAEHSASWQARLAPAGPPPYTGLTWRAGVAAGNRAARKQVSPAGLGRAIRDAPGTFIAVQRNPEAGEIEALIESTGRPVADFTAVNDDLEDALALMGLLDRYICVSNANLHFRAALGRTGNVLIPCPSEFRWMAAGPESPWFPGMAVSRQRPDGDWSDALAALKDSVQTAVGTRP